MVKQPDLKSIMSRLGIYPIKSPSNPYFRWWNHKFQWWNHHGSIFWSFPNWGLPGYPCYPQRIRVLLWDFQISGCSPCFQQVASNNHRIWGKHPLQTSDNLLGKWAAAAWPLLAVWLDNRTIECLVFMLWEWDYNPNWLHVWNISQHLPYKSPKCR